MSFATFNAHSSPLFFENKILKFPDIVSIENCIFVRNCFVNNAFSIFLNLFKLVSEVQSYSTEMSQKIYSLLLNTIPNALEIIQLSIH